MFGRKRNKKENPVTVETIVFNLVEEKRAQNDTELDKTANRLLSILQRHDMKNIDNDKVDALRMFLHYIKDDDIDANRLVKFLRS